MKIWNPKRYRDIDFKGKAKKKTTPKNTKNWNFKPERYDEHPYHFTI